MTTIVAHSSAEVGWRQGIVHGGGSAANCGIGSEPSEPTPGPGSYQVPSVFDIPVKSASVPASVTPRRKSRNPMLCGPSPGQPHYMQPLQRGEKEKEKEGEGEREKEKEKEVMGTHETPSTQSPGQTAEETEGREERAGGGGSAGGGGGGGGSVAAKKLEDRIAHLQMLLAQNEAAVKAYPPMTEDEMRMEADLITQRALYTCPNL